MNLTTKKNVFFRLRILPLVLLGAFELALPFSEANATRTLLSITPASFDNSTSSKIIFSPGGFNVNPNTQAIKHLCSLRNGTWVIWDSTISPATNGGFTTTGCGIDQATGLFTTPDGKPTADMQAIGMGPDISDYEKTYIKTFSLGIDSAGYSMARNNAIVPDNQLPTTDIYKMIGKSYVYATSIDPRMKNISAIRWILNSSSLPSDLKVPVAAGGIHTDVGFDHLKGVWPLYQDNMAPLLFSDPSTLTTEALTVESEMAIPQLFVKNSGFTQSNLWIDLLQTRGDQVRYPLGIQIRLMDSRSGAPYTGTSVSSAYFSTSLDNTGNLPGITVSPDNTFHLTNEATLLPPPDKTGGYQKISFTITKQNILDVIDQVNAKIADSNPDPVIRANRQFSTDLSTVRFQGAKIGSESGALLTVNNKSNPYASDWGVQLQINIQYLNVNQD
ncbi:hypothetical protein [Methylovulum psychrotolerans]|uniref:Uncharacterized protein n=1 Tax=Methylovulum psychrotolerans TaxID=1704499 RepID=A0A1Z4C324_9GAMM|nr:hypothetical protein [Methylovulum psychrotolerans]ASF47919.1 hypothetical protein CEK71_18625 [Methylovulum psychrotolerans]